MKKSSLRSSQSGTANLSRPFQLPPSGRASDASQEQKSVKVLSKAMQILQALSVSSRPQSVLDIALLTGDNRTTTHRLVSTLTDLGFIERDPVSSSHFNLGPETLPLASRYLNARPIRSVALPVLHTLAAETGYKAHLAIPVRGRIMYLGGFDDPQLPSLYAHFGQTAPMHCTSVGKSILAFLPLHERDALVEQMPFERFTPGTITDPAEFRTHLDQIHEQGYAEDRAEHKPGIYCVGVPIFDANYRPLGGISLVARDPEKLLQEVDRVKRTGRLISQALSVSTY